MSGEQQQALDRPTRHELGTISSSSRGSVSDSLDGSRGSDTDTLSSLPPKTIVQHFEPPDLDNRRRITRDGSSRGSVALSDAPYAGSIQVDGGVVERTRAHDTFIGEIDGRYSFIGNSAEDFVTVEVNADTTSTSQELMECKKTVLKPYLIFLKVIGWRRFKEAKQDLQGNKLHLVLNVLYPSIIFLLLVATLVIQETTCYFRTKPTYYRTDNKSHVPINCTDHIIVVDIVPNVLILGAYLYGIYIFRFGQPEHLTTLMESVFLSNIQQMSVKKKRIIGVLRSYLVLGSLWILLDFVLNVVRLYSLQLLDWDSFNPALRIPPDRMFNSTTRHNIHENILRYVFCLYSLFGFVFYDLLYFAVVVMYASQSQLIQYHILITIDKVRTKAYSLEDAIKDIRRTYNYLQVINSKLSVLTTLMLFLFLTLLFSSIHGLTQFPDRNIDSFQTYPIFVVGLVVSAGNILQWGGLAAAPLLQAARVTSRCRQLRRLGLEIGSRPFVYAGTPQLDLQYFMQYTNSTRYTAKLACVPIYPSLVMGLVFLGGVVGYIVISIGNYFEFADWF